MPDIRTAAQREAAWREYRDTVHKHHGAAKRPFLAGYDAGAAHVTPTRERLIEVAEKVIGEFPEYVLDPNKTWAQQEAEDVADAVLALMQELAEGESDGG